MQHASPLFSAGAITQAPSVWTCYHLVISWLRVQASWSSLCIFQQFFDEERIVALEEDAQEKLDRAVEAVRDAEVLNSTDDAACSE